MNNLNPQDLEIIYQDLAKDGVSRDNVSISQGNQCYYVRYGYISCYYFIKDSQVVNVVYD